MPPGSLSEIGERILLAAWKLNGLGERFVAEETLKVESSTSDEEFARELSILEAQGFITRSTLDKAEFTLTPLGLAILRQVEEDKLQELK